VYWPITATMSLRCFTSSTTLIVIFYHVDGGYLWLFCG
jgi:hypothetical protein